MYLYLVLFPICTLFWRVNKFISRKGEGIYRSNESTKTQVLFLFCSADDNNQYCFPFVVSIKIFKIPKLIFLQQKIIKYYCLIINFPVENGISKQKEFGSIK